MPEIMIRIRRILLNRHAIHKGASFEYNVVAVVVVVVIVKCLGFGDCGGSELLFINLLRGSGGRSHAAKVVVVVVVVVVSLLVNVCCFGFWCWLVHFRGFCFAATTASVCCEHGSKKAFLIGRH